MKTDNAVTLSLAAATFLLLAAFAFARFAK